MAGWGHRRCWWCDAYGKMYVSRQAMLTDDLEFWLQELWSRLYAHRIKGVWLIHADVVLRRQNQGLEEHSWGFLPSLSTYEVINGDTLSPKTRIFIKYSLEISCNTPSSRWPTTVVKRLEFIRILLVVICVIKVPIIIIVQKIWNNIRSNNKKNFTRSAKA